jgi:cytochrome c-type biogenesis protein CcsB
MKTVTGILFSSRLMAVLLALFAISIAVATFVENDFGSASARAVVYNAHWFEILLLLGAINLTGNIFTRKLYQKTKFTIFLFHLAFLLILAGSAITRYTGFEGTLSVREGEESGLVLTDHTYLGISFSKANDPGYEFPASFSALGRNKFSNTINLQGKTFSLSCKSFIPNAVPDIVAAAGGKPVAEIVYSDKEGRKSLIISSGETKTIGQLVLAFDTPPADSNTVILASSGDSLLFTAPFDVTRTDMADQSGILLGKNQQHSLKLMQLYSFGTIMLVLNKCYGEGNIIARPLPVQEGVTLDALQMEASSGQEKKEFLLWGKAGIAGSPVVVTLNNFDLIITYGSVYKELPFKLRLNDFIVDRYPGSQSPSWFESNVTLLDQERNVQESRRIYMNNILKYRGYRFYQSSYDRDEKGTILSVNHDWAGTLVTYGGYLLMGLGMALSLFRKNTRFSNLSAEITRLNAAKKALLAAILLVSVQGFSRAGETDSATVPAAVTLKHAELAGRMLIQDNSGRIEPLNTLSSEVLRKLYRKTTYKGLTSDQVFLGMLADPSTWQHEPIIRTTHPQIQELLGSGGKYFPFSSFFRDNNYVLHDYVDAAYRKKPAFRSKFDNEIIRLDERVNVAYLVLTGEIFRILPAPGDSTRTWYNYEEIQGKVNTGDSAFANNIIAYYLQDVQQSLKSGNWDSPDNIIRSIGNYQATCSADIMPSQSKVSLEVFLNKADIFARIANYYGLVGFVLLLLQFVSLFYTRIKLKVPVAVSIILIIILFLFHSSGLVLRWYVSGHAPWSNGYEALTYIAWATVLAGLIFANRSAITLSSTAILAFLILHTAHLSWMDPQITNLVPVLKSYWLVIHVATITASYGFLALGALLAFINLMLMIMQNRKNKQYIHITISELSCIVEMTLIAGLYLLTIGTFLGGVWANESWGRYWGWDPKETWALVTVLVYAFIVHMRMVPGLKGLFSLNLASLLGITSVIMTYFGVNYYLTGLHSYAKGDPLPVPSFVFYSMLIVAFVALAAFFNYRRLNKPDA